MSTSAENSEPSGVQEETRTLVYDRSHRATCCDLRSIKGRRPGIAVCWQHFDVNGSFADPLRNQRPCWLLVIDKFVKWTHRLLVASELSCPEQGQAAPLVLRHDTL